MSSFLEREHLSFTHKIKTHELQLVRKLYSNGAGNLFVWVFKFSISAENNIIPLNSNVVFYAVSLKMY